MKKALVLTWEKFQDHEVIYPFYALKQEGFEVDVAAVSYTHLTLQTTHYV